MNQYAKLAASGALFGSLFYLVLTGKIQASDYQTLAVGALGAVGGWHARSRGKQADHFRDAGKMVSTPQSIFIPQMQQMPIPDHIGDTTGMVASTGPDQFRDATKMMDPPTTATQELPK